MAIGLTLSNSGNPKSPMNLTLATNFTDPFKYLQEAQSYGDWRVKAVETIFRQPYDVLISDDELSLLKDRSNMFEIVVQLCKTFLKEESSCIEGFCRKLGKAGLHEYIVQVVGEFIPEYILEKYQSKPNEVGQAVKDAIDVGYRHFDCAYAYNNEKEIGQAIAEKIAEGEVKRKDLFITSKLWNSFHRPDEVEGALRNALQDLQLDYLDLYLIHWPTGFKEGKNGLEFTDDDYVDTWLAMEKVYEEGLAKSIGVSNFNKKEIERVLARATVVPVTNEVECHPYLNQNKLIDFCKSKNITLIAHTPLGGISDKYDDKPSLPKLLDNSKIREIAERYKKSPAQILIRYQIQRDVVVIPKSVHKNRIIENFQVFDFGLSESDMALIGSLDVPERTVKFDFSGLKKHKYYPFHDEY